MRSHNSILGDDNSAKFHECIEIYANNLVELANDRKILNYKVVKYSEGFDEDSFED